MAKKLKKGNLHSYKTEDPATGHEIKVYGLSLPHLGTAFSALHEWKDTLGIEDCILTMQKYPTLETKKVATRKKDEEGNIIYREKVEESRNDARRVLAFDFCPHDPKEARKLEYLFYDQGWPGTVRITALHDDMILDKESGTVVMRDDASTPESSKGSKDASGGELRLFQCELDVSDKGKDRADDLAKAFEDAFKDNIVELPEEVIGAFEKVD